MFRLFKKLMKTRTVILEQPLSFEFFSKPDGSFYIVAWCGTIGMYTVCMQLNEKELEGYQEYGDYYIEKLAAKIRMNPPVYEDRFVKE